MGSNLKETVPLSVYELIYGISGVKPYIQKQVNLHLKSEKSLNLDIGIN